MGTIAENLIELQQTKANIKAAIESKGQDLTDVPFTQYADKISAIQTGGAIDRLQWKCDNIKSLYYEFAYYTDTNFSILNGLDTSKVETVYNMFRENKNLVNAPMLDTRNVKDMGNMFYMCQKLETVPDYDTSNVTDMYGLFDQDIKLKKVPNFDTSNVTNFQRMFNNCPSLTEITNLNTSKGERFSDFFAYCTNLETIKNIDFYKASSSYSTNMFRDCPNLTNLEVHNIRINIAVGKGTEGAYGSYGSKLTLESLVYVINQLWDYGGTSTKRTLTLSNESKAKIQDVYVKLVDVTDEMLANDPYAANKKPCVVCESTDEGAMTLTEYATSKNWAIA